MEKLKILEYVLQNHYDCLKWERHESLFGLGDAGAPMPMFKAVTLADLTEKLEEWLKETEYWHQDESSSDACLAEGFLH